MDRPTNSDPILTSELAAAGDGSGAPPRPAGNPAIRNAEASDRLWWAAGVLFRRRWWIVVLSLLAGVGTAAITLQIPNRYYAEARLLLPESSGGLGALAASVSPGAAALLGSGGDYERYIAILTSRSAQDHIVDRFDLVRRYQMAEKVDPSGQARSKLEERSSFDVSLEYEYLAIGVLDEDPERAAQMANAYVEYLNERNAALTSESAMTNRQYIERRLERADITLDSLMGEMQGLQEQYGVIEPEAQSSAFMTALAQAQAAVSVAEIQYQTLLAEFGPDNPQTGAAAAGLAAARSQISRLEGGSETVMPVPFRRLPAVGRRFTRLQQQILVQAEILEQLQPLYEQAVLSERRNADAVQVVDDAIPPVRKAEPRRTIIVATATVSTFVALVGFFLAIAWLWTYARPLAHSLREASARVSGVER